MSYCPSLIRIASNIKRNHTGKSSGLELISLNNMSRRHTIPKVGPLHMTVYKHSVLEFVNKLPMWIKKEKKKRIKNLKF